MGDVKEVLGSYSTDITKTIEEELSTITPDNLGEASVYLTRAGGKMLRPALTLITAEAVGGDKKFALKSHFLQFQCKLNKNSSIFLIRIRFLDKSTTKTYI